MADGTYRKAIDKYTLAPIVIIEDGEFESNLQFTPTPAPAGTTMEQPLRVPITPYTDSGFEYTDLPIPTIKVSFEFKSYNWDGYKANWEADLKCGNVWLTNELFASESESPYILYGTRIEEL